MVERSPLFAKLDTFLEELKRDNERIEDYLKKGGDPKKISVEEISSSDEEEIQMNIIAGVYESKAQEPYTEEEK